MSTPQDSGFGHFWSPLFSSSVLTNSPSHTLSQIYTFTVPKARDRHLVGSVVPVARGAGACVSLGARKVREVWNEKAGEQESLGVYHEFSGPGCVGCRPLVVARGAGEDLSLGQLKACRSFETIGGLSASLESQDQEGRPQERAYSLHTFGDRDHVSI